MKPPIARFVVAFAAAAALLLPAVVPQQAYAAPPPATQQHTYAAEIAEVFDLHNEERAKRGVHKLIYAPALAVTYTQPYNDKLADADDGIWHNDMSKIWWPGTTTASENLGMANYWLAEPPAMMKSWMDSAGHRDNLLSSAFTYIAIGWSVTPEGMTYATVNMWGGPLQNLGVTYTSGAQILAAGADSGNVNVYTTAGYHNVGGRQWRTSCEVYSNEPRLVERCTAEIWGTVITYNNGVYSQVSGWKFNNLTYLPSPREYWVGNPLAVTGTFTSGGRQWKTSCGDDWTGPNACRSWILSDVVQSYIAADGTRQYRKVYNQWVFNNIVYFSN